MQIHNLKVKKKPDRKRVGRGGRRGTYSGRGMKGQKSRSGVSIDPLFEGGRSSLIERLKKNKGFKSPHPKNLVIKLEKINKYFSDGETVTVAELIKKGMIDKIKARAGVKIVGGGKLDKKIIFGKDIKLTESVKQLVK
jgi:large subunit ribosomal protein L15